MNMPIIASVFSSNFFKNFIFQELSRILLYIYTYIYNKNFLELKGKVVQQTFL